MRTTAIFAALMLVAAGWTAAAPDNTTNFSADIAPAPALRSPAATDQLAAQQRAAMAEARRLMEHPLPVAEPAAAATAAAAGDATHSSGANPAIIILILVVALLLAGAGVLFRLSRAPAEPAPAAGGPPKMQDDAAIIRAAFDSSGKSNPAAASANASNPRFMELLIGNRIITATERTSLENRFQGDHFAILLYMAEQRPPTRDTLAKLWSDTLDCAYFNPAKNILQTELLEKLPKNFARKNNIIPISLTENVVTVAMSDPNNTALQHQIENHFDCIVSPVFAMPAQIQDALEIAQVSLLKIKDQLSAKLAGSVYEGEKIAQIAADKSIAEFVRSLFILALKQRASDIHIEPRETGAAIRLRIDGALQEYLQVPAQLYPPLTNVIKIMAEADIGERRRPQDGRITLKLHDRELEFRFSCVPTIYGEKIVLRLLGQNQFAAVPRLEDLNFSRPILAGIRRIIESPNGIFFVTGPTGSGKTTTLYAALKELNRKDANIMTIEDPVEYRLKGVNQVQVNPLAGLTFATALRSFLRQDPDIILVGEIRDLETAVIAAQAALTGHLVLTTIHTNNALQAVTRLVQIGVEPFLVAPSIIGVMAQRLVRRLCDDCKEKYALAPEEAQEYFEEVGGAEVFFHRARGCEHCNFTGYAGRIAIHELFIIDEGTRAHIARNASILDIQKHAYSTGFTPMRYDGFKKILMGLTTIEEVNRATLTAD